MCNILIFYYITIIMRKTEQINFCNIVCSFYNHTLLFLLNIITISFTQVITVLYNLKIFIADDYHDGKRVN